MAHELSSLFPLLSLDPRVKCIVLTGSGTRSFCAGADLSTSPFDYSTDTPQTHRDGGGQVAIAIHRCNKPVIAAINGSAVGVGITMTLPCSIRVVSEKAKIGFVFARRGIVMYVKSCPLFEEISRIELFVSATNSAPRFLDSQIILEIPC